MWTWLRKGNLKRETEHLLIASKNNAVRTNNIKARIDKTQQNSRCRLCDDTDEAITHVKRKCSKLTEKKLDKSRWASSSTVNSARNLNLTIQTNGLCPTQHLSWRMRHTDVSVILISKRIPKSRPDDQTLQ